MQYGLISLILVQLVIAGACAMVYLRQRNAQDVDKRDRETFGARLEVVYGMADSAKKSIETIELTHYKALFAKYEIAVQEITRLEAEVRRLKESVESLSNKLASREKLERKAMREMEREEAAAAKEPAGEPTGAGASGVDALLRANGIPLFAQPPAAPEAAPSTFGKTAKGVR